VHRQGRPTVREDLINIFSHVEVECQSIERTMWAGNVWYPRTQQSVLKATYAWRKAHSTCTWQHSYHGFACRHVQKKRGLIIQDEIVVSAVPKSGPIGLKKTQSCSSSHRRAHTVQFVPAMLSF